MNESYFTNRQDRYLHFKSAALSNYCLGFLHTMSKYTFQLQPSSDSSSYSLSWPNQSHRPQHIELPVGEALRSYQSQQRQGFLDQPMEEASNQDILLYPIIQGGQFNIREEERCMDQLFVRLDQYAKTSGRNPLVDITSGYFGLYKPYQEFVRKYTNTDVRVLTASPKVGHTTLCSPLPNLRH